ncbi:hypothetical protein GCK72_003612 [Caenorhabditis remanei]|uniref:Cysteine protease n=1 Tax=Caenorhabditis remanei TaxID=31234 RepID=A0A6A5HYI8_CAERE|nr:hypothetical protein GCK72_003612 [Caenorhabditis remanei]KAF1771783.1 hypothetical protein GCK72_003612 [Caenorhabditis remanei]
MMNSEVKQGVGMVETSLTSEPPFCDSFERISIDTFPIWALGRIINKEDGLEAMKKYMTSRLWFTYRRDFSPIGGTGPSTDQGWGCMLRCAQMLLGEVLLRRHIGRHFEWDIEETSEVYEKILQMFFDEKDALYSIHQIAQMGVTEGKKVSEWFGPNTAAQVIKKLTIFDDWSNIAVHVALDNILVKEDALTMATTYPSDDAVKLIMENGQIEKPRPSSGCTTDWRPLLVMIPLRLGLTSINPCYLPAIQKFFELPQCVGIIGGKPNLAHYFVGIAGTKLFYLDPHHCRAKTAKRDAGVTTNTMISSITTTDAQLDIQNQIDDSDFHKLEDLEPLPSQTSDVYTKMDDSTYHCQMMQWMEYESIDPSLALALFCETRQDFDTLCEELQKTTLPSSVPPMFEFLEKRPRYLPRFEPYTGVSMKIEMKEFDDIGAANVKIDDDFEVLDVSVDENSSNTTTEKLKKVPKFYKLLNWEKKESEKKLNNIEDLRRVNLNTLPNRTSNLSAVHLCSQNPSPCLPGLRDFEGEIRTAPRYHLSTCVVQKSMSTVMTSLFCYLRDEKKFIGNNREILKDWKIIRFCMFKNEFRNLGGLFKKINILPSANNWTHIMMVRNPIERFISGFVDKCYRKPVVSNYCNGCKKNLTCFMETELARMKEQVKRGKFLKTYEDRHFFPQSW